MIALLTLSLLTAGPSPAIPRPAVVLRAASQPVDELQPLDPLPVSATGLTANQVAEKAVAASPEIESRAAAVQIADAQVDQTVVSFLPQVQLSAGYTRLSDIDVTFGSGALVGAANEGLLGLGPCPDGSGAQCVVDGQGVPVGASSFDIPQILDQFELKASLSVPISDYILRFTRGIEAAKTSKKAAEASKEAERRKVDIDARVAYYDWVRSVAQVSATEDAIKTAKARLEDVAVAYDAGLRTTADIKRIEVLVANAEFANLQAKAFEEVARERLSTMMNVPVEQWEVGEDVMEADTSGTAPGLESSVETAVRSRPEVEALELNVDALVAGMKTERAGYFPRLDAFGEVLYANPNQRIFPQTQEWNATWAVGAKLSYTLGGPLATRQKLKEYEGQKRQLNAQAIALQRGIRLEVTQAWVERKTALGRIEVAEKSRLASDEAYRVVAIQFAEGKATATDVIEAQGERLDSLISAYNARIDLRVANAKLAYATGESLAPSAPKK
jgi:outer membrane protein TolC